MERGILGVCGSISADVIGYGPRLPVAGETLQGSELLIASGGKGANQAVAAARLGASVRLTGARGADAFGELCAAALAADGVALDRVAVHDDTHTGVALICVGEDGENQILALPGANGRCLPPEPCGARVWLCQAEVPDSANAGVLAAAQQDGALSVINPSPTHAIDRELLARFDLAVVNEAEAKALEGFLPEARVVTLGAAGALLLPEGDELPGLDVTAIDTTGAGDALCGTFAGGLAAGLPRRQALARAIVAAGISVERRGCQPSYATRTEVERRLRW
jgi:ribokinase